MNNDTNNLSDIYGIIRLKSQAVSLAEGIDDIVASIFKIKGIGLNDRINNRFSKDIAAALISVMDRNNIDGNDFSKCKAFFDLLQNVMIKAKVAYLTIGIEPESDLILEISEFFRTTFSDQSILVDIKTDHSILGGAEVIWLGKYYNLGLDKQIDRIIANTNENI